MIITLGFGRLMWPTVLGFFNVVIDEPIEIENHWLKFKTSRKLLIILHESIEYAYYYY